MTRQPLAAPRQGPAFLLVLASAALLAVHYCMRTNTVGVLSGDRGWHPLTGGPHSALLYFVGSCALLGVLPVLGVRRLTGLRSLTEVGLGIGRWREGLGWLALGVPAAVAVAWVGAHSPEMRAVYPIDPTVTTMSGAFIRHSLLSGLFYLSWEVLFRGVLLFGLRPSAGDSTANALQAVLSTLAHFGAPLPETLLALPAGLLLGALDLRIGSVWYLAVVHWALAIGLDGFILAGV